MTEPFWALLYLAANSHNSMSQTWVSHATEVVEAQGGKGTPEVAVSINHCCPQKRLQEGPRGREHSKPAPPGGEPCPCPGGCEVGHVPAESLTPPQRPQSDPHSHHQAPESLSGPAYLSDSLGVPLGLGTGGSCSFPR